MRYALWLVMLAGCNQLFGIHELAAHDATPIGDDDASHDAAVCSATQVDCDGIASNGCETDLDSDGSNCGVCGHSCGGDACGGGLCAVKTYVESTTEFVPSLALFQGSVLWVDLDSSVVDYVPVDSSDPPQRAAQSAESPFWIVADGGGYYWFDDNGATNGIVFACSELPCDKPLILATEPDKSASTSPSTGAIDAKQVYWHSSSATPSLSAVQKNGGGAPTTVVTNDGNSSNGMVVVGNNVYYTQCCGTATGLYMVPISGGTPIQVETALGDSIMTFEGGIYGADLEGNLVAFDTTTNQDTPVQTGAERVGRVTVDASGIYASIGDDTSGQIVRVDPDTDRLIVIAPAAGVQEIVTDDNYLYWSENAAGGADAVRRVHK